MPRSAEPTLEEIVAAINHSSLPTVVVEGRDDIIAYRVIEQIYADRSISVLPVGGRERVLAIYDQRQSLRNSGKVVFIADLDLWVFTGVPDEYTSESIAYTEGYSLENDVFADGNLLDLLTSDERIAFNLELQRVIRCYSLAVERALGGNPHAVAIHPNQLLETETEYEKYSLPDLSKGETYPEERYAFILNNYIKFLRGKTLLGVLMRQLARKGRVPQHHPKALIETASRSRDRPNLQRIFDFVGQATSP